jgi:hypothetical protein
MKCSLILPYPFATSVYNEVRIRALVPFMHVLRQFIALTTIDVFAYCAIGFMVCSLFTFRSKRKLSRNIRKTSATAGYRQNLFPIPICTYTYFFS